MHLAFYFFFTKTFYPIYSPTCIFWQKQYSLESNMFRRLSKRLGWGYLPSENSFCDAAFVADKRNIEDEPNRATVISPHRAPFLRFFWWHVFHLPSLRLLEEFHDLTKPKFDPGLKIIFGGPEQSILRNNYHFYCRAFEAKRSLLWVVLYVSNLFSASFWQKITFSDTISFLLRVVWA